MQLEKNTKEEEKECYLEARPLLDLPLLPVNMEKSPKLYQLQIPCLSRENCIYFFRLFFFLDNVLENALKTKCSINRGAYKLNWNTFESRRGYS